MADSKEKIFNRIYNIAKPRAYDFSFGGFFGLGASKGSVEVAPAFASNDPLVYGGFLSLRNNFPYSHAFDILEVKLTGDFPTTHAVASLTPLKGLGYYPGLKLQEITKLEEILRLDEGDIREMLGRDFAKKDTTYFIENTSHALAHLAKEAKDKNSLREAVAATLKENLPKIKATRSALIKQTNGFDMDGFIEEYRKWLSGAEA